MAEVKTTLDIINDHRTSRDVGAPLTYPLSAPTDYAEMVEVAEGILWFRMPLPYDLDHINLYLLKDGDGWAILDSGVSTSKVRDLWEKILNETLGDAKITKIIITHYHPDHMGLSGWLHEVTGAEIHMTALEMLTGRSLKGDAAGEVPTAVLDFYQRAGFDEEQLNFIKAMGFGNFSKVVYDLPVGYVRIKGGDELCVGDRVFKVLIGSGHSPEHACLYCQDEKILIAGDQILPKITSNISVYPTEPLANPLSNWIDSLHMLHDLHEDTLVLPAHNEVFIGLHKRIDEILSSHIRRFHSVVEHCQTPKTAVEAFSALFKRKLKGFDMIMGLGESLAHLHFLEKQGVVERNETGGVTKFVSKKKFDEDTVKIK